MPRFRSCTSLFISHLGASVSHATINGVRAFLVAAMLLVASAGDAADRVDPLARARLLYNQGEWDAAVAAAEEGGRSPDKADGADLIAARAYLEKFRQTSSPDDLALARDRLRRIQVARLTPPERIEWVVGLGETLYLDGSAGAASELFDSVLDDISLADDARERVLDWWASALDEEGRRRGDAERAVIYGRIRERMRIELGRNPASAASSYWLAAAARGQGDLQAAWDSAQAGWVRAALTGASGDALREDLDRLVVRALVPERARALGQAEYALLDEWDQFKERWQK
jgi:hypothetical protein